MPLFYQQNINDTSRLGVWKISEKEDFFQNRVFIQRNITHPQKRLQHLAARYLLPYLFADFPLEEIAIAESLKPFLPNEQYHFSLSHCINFAAALVSQTHRVGVDIEVITSRVHKIKGKFLHPTELAFVNKHPEATQTRLLTLLWSVKEAMYKWWGNGGIDFSESLRTVPFVLGDKGTILLLNLTVLSVFVKATVCSTIKYS